MSRPLDGICVLDFSRVVAGPACTAALCNMGAEVLKIEPPEGDLLRRARPRRNGIALTWSQVNCGKLCLSFDLNRPEGRAIAAELAMEADVVVENFRPGVMARMGLGPDELRAGKPDLVYCSISGYGQDGPAAQRRAYAPVIHAELGLIELGTHRGTPPVPEPVSHADFAVASQATSAILAALFHRQRTGEGQHLDVSMAETMLAVLDWTAIEANGGMGDEIPTFYPAKAALVRVGDGSYVQLPGNPATTFPTYLKLMGRTELLNEERFATPKARSEHLDDVNAVIAEWALTFGDRAAFEGALASARLPAGEVKALRDIPNEDWAIARGAFATLDDGEGGTIRLPYSPMRFSAQEVGLRGTPAHQGQHNREVLARVLGYDAAQLDRLEADAVLVSRR
jgi:crotonobetainyl-CoA:carnitine CoA-transferase CaiB-like acyl-CoA transferase